MEVTWEFQWSGCILCVENQKPPLFSQCVQRWAPSWTAVPRAAEKIIGMVMACACMSQHIPTEFVLNQGGFSKKLAIWRYLDGFLMFLLQCPSWRASKEVFTLKWACFQLAEAVPKLPEENPNINSNRNVPRCPNILDYPSTYSLWLTSIPEDMISTEVALGSWNPRNPPGVAAVWDGFHRLPAPIHGCGNGTPVAGNGDWHARNPATGCSHGFSTALHGVIFSCPIPWFENWWRLKVQKGLVL